MNVNGTVKIFKLEPQNNGKVVKGQLFYSTNVGTKDQPEFETDFINCKLVGKANDKLRELATKGNVEKLKINVTSGKLRNRSYQSKDGQYRTWLEITVFDFELPEVKPHNQNGFGFTGKKF